MTETERAIERLIAEVRRNTEIVALVHLLEKAERCQQHAGLGLEGTCGEYAVIRAHYGAGSGICLCQAHWDERQRSNADPAVQEMYKEKWGRVPEPPRVQELPRAKQVRRLLALLKGEG